nr:hypothetical protein [Candidatus Woesearchaeota archaeon]
METISVKFEDNFLGDIEKIMKKHRYSTRTEFIREAIRDKIIDLEKEELLKNLDKLYGSSKRKTTNKELHKVREEVFKELENKFK